MKQSETKKGQNGQELFSCELCDYITTHKGHYNRHKMTAKHQSETNVTKKGQNGQEHFQCNNCEKVFKNRTSHWRHKKTCLSESDKDSLIIQLLNQNKELQKSLIDLSKEKSVINNTHNGDNNNTFNLQLFLNETCKNALNIKEFVSSIKLTLEDLEYTGKKGYVDGICNIVCKNIKQLEQNRRPFHCTDSKREVLYIKDNNKWSKETDDKPILTNAIKLIANENIKNIIQWKNKNPECMDPSSKKNDVYLNIVSNAMSGITKEESEKNINKIISNISKEIIIQK